MKTKKKTKGVGRPSIGKKKKRVFTVCLAPEIAALLDREDNKSLIMEKSLRFYFYNHPF